MQLRHEYAWGTFDSVLEHCMYYYIHARFELPCEIAYRELVVFAASLSLRRTLISLVAESEKARSE